MGYETTGQSFIEWCYEWNLDDYSMQEMFEGGKYVDEDSDTRSAVDVMQHYNGLHLNKAMTTSNPHLIHDLIQWMFFWCADEEMDRYEHPIPYDPQQSVTQILITPTSLEWITDITTKRVRPLPPPTQEEIQQSRTIKKITGKRRKCQFFLTEPSSKERIDKQKWEAKIKQLESLWKILIAFKTTSMILTPEQYEALQQQLNRYVTERQWVTESNVHEEDIAGQIAQHEKAVFVEMQNYSCDLFLSEDNHNVQLEVAGDNPEEELGHLWKLLQSEPEDDEDDNEMQEEDSNEPTLATIIAAGDFIMGPDEITEEQYDGEAMTVQIIIERFEAATSNMRFLWRIITQKHPHSSYNYIMGMPIGSESDTIEKLHEEMINRDDDYEQFLVNWVQSEQFAKHIKHQSEPLRISMEPQFFADNHSKDPFIISCDKVYNMMHQANQSKPHIIPLAGPNLGIFNELSKYCDRGQQIKTAPEGVEIEFATPIPVILSLNAVTRLKYAEIDAFTETLLTLMSIFPPTLLQFLLYFISLRPCYFYKFVHSFPEATPDDEFIQGEQVIIWGRKVVIDNLHHWICYYLNYHPNGYSQFIWLKSVTRYQDLVTFKTIDSIFSAQDAVLIHKLNMTATFTNTFLTHFHHEIVVIREFNNPILSNMIINANMFEKLGYPTTFMGSLCKMSWGTPVRSNETKPQTTHQKFKALNGIIEGINVYNHKEGLDRWDQHSRKLKIWHKDSMQQIWEKIVKIEQQKDDDGDDDLEENEEDDQKKYMLQLQKKKKQHLVFFPYQWFRDVIMCYSSLKLWEHKKKQRGVLSMFNNLLNKKVTPNFDKTLQDYQDFAKDKSKNKTKKIGKRNLKSKERAMSSKSKSKSMSKSTSRPRANRLRHRTSPPNNKSSAPNLKGSKIINASARRRQRPPK